jgi:rRNA maturation RNase YbeY
MVQYIVDSVEMPVIDKKKINRWIKIIAADYQKNTGEICYIFCDDKKILEVNNQYLSHDYFTDIITFDYGKNDQISGDIFISIDTVKANAEEFGVSFNDELNRILIHGILHLCGQNDNTPELRKAMIDKENVALEKLRIII